MEANRPDVPGKQTEPRGKLVELGCKVLLGLFGFVAVEYALLFLLIPQAASPGLWLYSGLLEACGFFGVLYWYLWHTAGGVHMLARIWSWRKRFAGVR